MDKPMDVLRDFPVRKGKTQKERFRAAVRSYTEKMGYSYQEEPGSFGSRNLVLGDPEQAEILITAHYDTCAHLPFPNLITPCNPVLFVLYQLLVAVLMCAVILGAAVLALYLTDSLVVYLLCLYGALFLVVWFMLCGPANRHNANDNTSGVVAVLETAASLPPDLRDKVCFVLFDLEEAGLVGSSSYRKRHRKTIGRQWMFNLDCVGDGDEILLFPSRAIRQNGAFVERLRACCPPAGEKTLTVRDRGFAFYPSDQAGFPLGVGVAALRRSSWAGLYLSRIHTNCDTALEEANVRLLRDYLIKIIETYHRKGCEL